MLLVTGVNDYKYFNTLNTTIRSQTLGSRNNFFNLSFTAAHPPREGYVTSIRRNLLETCAPLTHEDSTLLYINDHGEWSRRTADPFDAGIYLPNKSIYTNAQLLKDMNSDACASKKIRIIATNCYSGAVHHVAFERANTCSAASTAHNRLAFTKAEVPSYDRNLPNFLFQKNLAMGSPGQKNLYKTHLAAFFKDYVNDGKGQISSAAYVDYILQEGAYAKSSDEPKSFSELLTEINPKISSKEIETSLLDPLNPYPAQLLKGACTLSYPRSKTLDQLLHLADFTYTSLEQDVSKGGYSPKELEPYVRSVLDAWKNALANDGEKIQEFFQKFHALKVSYSRLPLNEQARRRGEFTQNFDTLDRSARIRLGKIWATFNLLKSYQRIQQFFLNDRTTPEQKQKLMDLIRCELEPL